MTQTANAKVDNLLATESDLLRQQKIHNIPASIEAHVYQAEKVSTTKHSQYGVRLNRAQHAATTWSDADDQKVIEHLEHEIHPVTPVECKLFDK